MANWKTIFNDLKNAYKFASNPVNYIADSAIKKAANSNAAKSIGNAISERWGVSNVKYDEPIGPQPASKSTGDTSGSSKPKTTSSSKSLSTGSSGGGGNTTTLSSYETAVKPYLDQILAAYNQGAEANKTLVKATYDSKVNNLNEVLRQARENYEFTSGDLETSLRRYQEQNARNVENQRKAYLTDQAALESARLEADRQTRIDAAARGLGGSGLQQLAQLQNLLNQGQDISNLATSNEDVLDKLRTQLAEQTEDINTKKEQARRVLEAAETSNKTGLNELLDAYNAQIQGINADLSDKIAKANYDFGSNNYSAIQAEKAAAAANAARSSASNNANALLDYYRIDLQDSLDSLGSMDSETLSNLKTSLGLGSKATITQVADKLVNQSLGYGASVSGISPNQLSAYNTSLRDIRNNANLNNTNAKKSSLLDYITGAIRG